eukprot:5777240-Prymnesium_polylepis.2
MIAAFVRYESPSGGGWWGMVGARGVRQSVTENRWGGFCAVARNSARYDLRSVPYTEPCAQ